VPSILSGQRCGASAIRLIARLSSSVNFEAANSLRAKYQSNAASYSELASSWSSTSLFATSTLGQNPTLNFFPRNGFSFSGV